MSRGCYLPGLSGLVVFGGTDGERHLGDLWMLADGPRQGGRRWTKLCDDLHMGQGSAPPGRSNCALCPSPWAPEGDGFAASSSALFVHGGEGQDGVPLADAWIWASEAGSSRGAWTFVEHLGPQPSPRASHSVVALQGRWGSGVLLFGGSAIYEVDGEPSLMPTNDLWVLERVADMEVAGWTGMGDEGDGATVSRARLFSWTQLDYSARPAPLPLSLLQGVTAPAAPAAPHGADNYAPSPRSLPAMAVLPSGSGHAPRVLLYGGFGLQEVDITEAASGAAVERATDAGDAMDAEGQDVHTETSPSEHAEGAADDAMNLEELEGAVDAIRDAIGDGDATSGGDEGAADRVAVTETFLSDLWVLDLRLGWRPLEDLDAPCEPRQLPGQDPDALPIAGRNAHSLTLCGRHLVLFGGFEGDRFSSDAYIAPTESVAAAADACFSEGLAGGPLS